MAQKKAIFADGIDGGGCGFLYFVFLRDSGLPMLRARKVRYCIIQIEVMIDKNLLTETITKSIAGTDLFLVDVTVSPANSIVVEVDSPTGVDIDACARITRDIEAAFDRDVEDYELEVGSAGLTAPFKVKGQYEKNIGNDVEVLTIDGRKLKGRLTEVGEDTFTIEVTRKVKEPGAKRPVEVAEPLTLGYDQTKSVKYLIQFK